MHTAILVAPRSSAVIEQWQAISEEYVRFISPKAKNAAQVLDHVMNHYPSEVMDSADAKKVAECNALAYHVYLPDGIFQHGLDVVVLKIKNEGAGKLLYDRQKQEYKELIEEHRKLIKDAEDLPDEDFPLPVIIGVEKHSGYFYVEGSPSLSEEIMMLQGLNEKELKNTYIVANYVTILKKHGHLDRLKQG